jgi:hypothetical protein
MSALVARLDTARSQRIFATAVITLVLLGPALGLR